MVVMVVFIFSLLQDSIPFKPNNEFEIELDYKFKVRPGSSQNEFYFNETSEENRRRVNATPLPYLTLEFKILKVSRDEDRLRIMRNGNQFVTKKNIVEGNDLKIEMGFTDDMKDRVAPHEYVLVFMDKNKQDISKIVIFIEEDGSFIVNGEKRGKF